MEPGRGLANVFGLVYHVIIADYEAVVTSGISMTGISEIWF